MNRRMDEPFTRVSNEILEALSRTKLNGSEYAIILFVIRNTYGFGKKSKPMSISYIAEGTGIHRTKVADALNKLIKNKILVEYKSATVTTSREIGFNKKVNEWCHLIR